MLECIELIGELWLDFGDLECMRIFARECCKAVLSCGHCNQRNNVSHKAQHILGRIELDKPFDIVSFDIWVPGVTNLLDKEYFKKKGGMKDPKFRQASLTGLCLMTGFAGVAFLLEMSGKEVANQVLAHFIMIKDVRTIMYLVCLVALVSKE
jgi:hypothetical protein